MEKGNKYKILFYEGLSTSHVSEDRAGLGDDRRWMRETERKKVRIGGFPTDKFTKVAYWIPVSVV